MRITLAMLCVLAASVAGFSQEKSFNLNHYKFPDYKRHELELNFNSSGQGFSQYFETSLPDLQRANKYDYTNFQSNSRGALAYTYDKHTRKHIDRLHASLSGLYDYSKSNNTQDKTKVQESLGTWNFSGASRYYLTRDQLFLEGLGTMWFDYSDNKRSNETIGQNLLTTRNKSSSLSLSAGVGIGIGRIEQVNDLWQAYYILEKLNGQKSLNRELQEKDIFEFAALASRLKNQRFFDARIRKMAELKALDSLLQAQGLIDKRDIGYFTTLNDYWSYGFFPERKSGSELKAQLLPEYESHYWKGDESLSITSSQTNLISKIQWDHTKQLNLFWERNFSIMVSNSTLLATDEKLSDDYPSNLFSAGAMAGMGFFPNSRTSVRLQGSYSGNEFGWAESPNETARIWNNSFTLSLLPNYYISPQLQLTAGVNGRYGFSELQSRKDKSISYQVGLRYAIF